MRALLTLAVLLTTTGAAAQSLPRHRLGFGGGWSREFAGYSYPKDTATGLGLSYGYRVLRFLEAEAGVFAALQPTPDIRGANYFLDPDDRFLWVPFGVRFLAPLYLRRIEFAAGGGGLYEKYSVSNPSPGFGVQPHSGLGGYFVGSASIALDRGKHFWLGAAPRWFLANPPYRRDRWFQILAEFSVRFR
jgi:hypothetical protein